MNARLSSLINNTHRIKKLNEIIESLEEAVASDYKNSLIDQLREGIGFCRGYIDFTNVLIKYASSLDPSMNRTHAQEELQKCQDRLVRVLESVDAEKSKETTTQEKVKEADEKKQKLISKTKKKLGETAEEVVHLFSSDIKVLKEKKLLIEPLDELIMASFFKKPFPEILTYAKAIDGLYKAKTKNMISAFIDKFEKWAIEHTESFKKISIYKEFIFALKDIAMQNKLLITKVITNDKEKKVGEFFVFINQINQAKAMKAHENADKIDAVFTVVEMALNIPKLKIKLLQAKDDQHLAAINAAKEWLTTKPEDIIKKAYITHILNLEEEALEFSDNEEVAKTLAELKKIYKERYPDQEIPAFKVAVKKVPASTTTATMSELRLRMRARQGSCERLVREAKEWLQTKPEDEIKETYAMHIRTLEFAAIDMKEKVQAAELAAKLEELIKRYKELYPKDEVPTTQKRKLVRDHTRQRSFTVGQQDRVTMLPVKPLILPEIKEQEDAPETSEVKAPQISRVRGDSNATPRLIRRASSPRLNYLSRLFSTKKSSPRQIVVSPRAESKGDDTNPPTSPHLPN